MRIILFIFILTLSLFANILESGLVSIDGDSVVVSNGAEFYAYIDKLGDKNLTNAYRQAIEPFDRLNNPYLDKANVGFYEEAYANLRYFYYALYDKNGSNYIDDKSAGFVKKRMRVINRLLAAKRKQFNDETIVALLIKEAELTRQINFLEVEKLNMYSASEAIVDKVLNKEYIFENSRDELANRTDVLQDKIAKSTDDVVNATLKNELFVVLHKMSFITAIESTQYAYKNNSWNSAESVSFADPGDNITILDIDKNSPNYAEYDYWLNEAIKTISDAKVNDEIDEIIFDNYEVPEFQRKLMYLSKTAVAIWKNVRDYPLFTFQNNNVQTLDVINFLEAVVISLSLQWVAVLFLRKKFNYGIGHLSIFIIKFLVTSYIVYYFAVNVLGLNPTNLAMFASAFSIAIGFGMQSLIQNFVAGIILIGDRTVKIGDNITIGGQNGVVDSITYRTTTMKTKDNTFLLIPNSKIFLDTVENKTKFDSKVRVKALVLVPHNSNLVEVEKTFNEACKNIKGFVEDAPTKLVINSFVEKGIMVDFRLFVSDADYSDASTAARILYDALQKSGQETALLESC